MYLRLESLRLTVVGRRTPASTNLVVYCWRVLFWFCRPSISKISCVVRGVSSQNSNTFRCFAVKRTWLLLDFTWLLFWAGWLLFDSAWILFVSALLLFALTLLLFSACSDTFSVCSVTFSSFQHFLVCKLSQIDSLLLQWGGAFAPFRGRNQGRRIVSGLWSSMFLRNSRGALTPSNVHRTFSVRLIRFTANGRNLTGIRFLAARARLFPG